MVWDMLKANNILVAFHTFGIFQLLTKESNRSADVWEGGASEGPPYPDYSTDPTTRWRT